jgi:hypothetical protein
MNYSPNARLEDRLHPLEPPYRSRGEAQVGRLLDRAQIPFLHEQPTLIYDRGRHRIWRPDFTLPTYGGLIVEYAGMMDVPDYAAGIEHKAKAYARNEIPAVFVYPEDLRYLVSINAFLSHIEESGHLIRPATQHRGLTGSAVAASPTQNSRIARQI